MSDVIIRLVHGEIRQSISDQSLEFGPWFYSTVKSGSSRATIVRACGTAQSVRPKKPSSPGKRDDVELKLDKYLSSLRCFDSISYLSRLRDDIARLPQTVSDLAQKQVASSRDQVAGVVGAAEDSLSQSAAVAQDKFAAVEGDVEAPIKKNPWGAVAIAGLIGLLIGKMS